MGSGMQEVEEGAESASGQAGKGQNLVYTLPHTTASIAEFLAPVLGRIDPAAGGTQVVVVTRDAETALIVSETILRLSGAAGIEVVPVTSASRAGRLLQSRPVLAVAGTPAELLALVQGSRLKAESVRGVVIAWADDILESGAEPVAALETLLGELGDAARTIVTRKVTPPVESFIERYARRARRVAIAEQPVEAVAAAVEGETPFEMPFIQYLTVAASSRPAALRRLLDQLDPPSAAIVARDEPAEVDVSQVLRTLGYKDDDSSIRMVKGAPSGAAHAVIFYQPPVTSAELRRVASAKPVQIVIIAQPGEIASLREVAGSRLKPLNLAGPERRARDREEAVRHELRAVLARGVPPREIISLEPLLEEYDAAELAAAALHILDRERAQRRLSEGAAPADAPARSERAASPTSGAGEMTRLFMTIGTRDGVKAGDIVGAIAGESGIPADRIGKVDVRESHTLVEVAAGDAASTIERVNGSMIHGRRVVVRGERDREQRDRATAGRGDRPTGRGDRPSAGRGERPSSGRGERPPRRGGPPERSSRGPSSGPPGRSARGGPPGRNRDRS